MSTGLKSLLYSHSCTHSKKQSNTWQGLSSIFNFIIVILNFAIFVSNTKNDFSHCIYWVICSYRNKKKPKAHFNGNKLSWCFVTIHDIDWLFTNVLMCLTHFRLFWSSVTLALKRRYIPVKIFSKNYNHISVNITLVAIIERFFLQAIKKCFHTNQFS